MFRISRLSPVGLLLLAGPLLVAQTQKPATTTTANTIADGDWPAYDRNYAGDRYSPLSEITARNVTALEELTEREARQS